MCAEARIKHAACPKNLWFSEESGKLVGKCVFCTTLPSKKEFLDPNSRDPDKKKEGNLKCT
jgi:hypothetical protein